MGDGSKLSGPGPDASGLGGCLAPAEERGLDDLQLHLSYVALLQDADTAMRGYALTDGRRGWRDGDRINWPADMVIGLAYPCFEDVINALSGILSALATCEPQPNSEYPPIPREALEPDIEACKASAQARLELLIRRFENLSVFLLGVDPEKLKETALHFMSRGITAQAADRITKNFSLVDPSDPCRRNPDRIVRYEPTTPVDWRSVHPQLFIAALLRDVLDSVRDETGWNYVNTQIFAATVMTKFKLLMDIVCSVTDPVFYGTHRSDYGVSSDNGRQMTAMYRAAAAQLREFSEYRQAALESPDWSERQTPPASFHPSKWNPPQDALPEMVQREQLLLPHFHRIAGLVQVLSHYTKPGQPDHDEVEAFCAALQGTSRSMVQALRAFGIISSLAAVNGEVVGATPEDTVDSVLRQRAVLRSLDFLAGAIYDQRETSSAAILPMLPSLQKQVVALFHTLEQCGAIDPGTPFPVSGWDSDSESIVS